jgi:chitodextrinase
MLKIIGRQIDVTAKTWALLACLMAFGPAATTAATTFSNVSANTSAPAQFDKYEIDFDLSAAYVNPVDPGEVDVQASFLTPTGQTEVVPGFYNKTTSPKWAVRYAPRLTGTYSVTIKVTDAGGVGQSSSYTFTATAPGSNRGFMGVSGTRFIDSSGKQLTLVGTNFAWGDPTQFLTALPTFQTAKINALRVWFSVWWGNYAPEWGPTTTTQNGITMVYNGVGKYQMENMARMDALMDGAAAHNIYVMLTMNSFGDFYYDWAQNAYNTANGGPTTYSDNNASFWTDSTAIAYQKKLLRYMFARWGYSRGFGMLEYWNESDNHVDTDATTRGNWHTAMDNYWKSWDFYQRPTTTSFAWKDHSDTGQTSWTALPTLSATNIHNYGSQATIIDYLETNVKYMLSNYGARPAFIGEFGTTGNESSSDPGMTNYIHDIIWAPMFRAGGAGAGMYWSSSDYGFALSPTQKTLYTALANFVQPEELYLPSMPFVDYGAQANSTKVGGFKKADRALLWINNTTATWNISSPSTISGMTFTVPAVTNGLYNITFFDTTAGTTIATTTATASGGNLVIAGIPSFTRDIAIKAIASGSADTTPPTVPTNLAAPSKSDVLVTLTWTASTDAGGIAGYDVYKGSVLAGSTSGATTFTVTGLTANTTYTFTVKARDLANNVSAASSGLNVTTNPPPPPDTTPPSAPANLVSSAKTDVTVSLSWGASSDNVGVVAYDVYTNGTSAGSTSSSTSFTVAGLTANTTYSFTVKARDAASNVSAASNAVSVTTLPPIPPNLLQDGGFESADGSGTATMWTYEQVYYCSRDTTVKRTGSASLRWQGNTGPWFGMYQDVSGTPGTTYTFDGYVNIVANTGELDIKIQFLDGSNAVLADNNASIFSGTTTAGFVNVHAAYVAPANTVKVRVYPYIRGLNGTIYYDDFSLASGSGGGGDTTPPSAPTGLASPSKTSSSVSLSWTASTDNVGVTGYDIYNGATVAGSTTGATTFTVTGLAANTAYTFTVKAKDAANNVSAASGALSITTFAAADTTPPSAPTGLTSPSKTTSSVNLSWTASTDNVGVTAYDIYNGAAVAGSTTGATTFTVTGLAANTAYSFTVKAKDAANNVSAASGVLSVTTLAAADTTPPSAPTGLTSPSKTTSSVSLSWTASTDNVGVTGYDIYNGAAVAGSTTGATTFTVTGLASNTAYSFTVKAKDAANNVSAASGALSVTTSAVADTTPPSAPTGLTSPSKTSSSVSLSWTASTDNVGVTGYDIYNGATVVGSTTGATTFTVTGLAANTAYSFTVKAKDAANNVSAASGVLSVTTSVAVANLLVNPGFETDNGAGKPASWTFEQDYYCYTDTTVKRSGTSSLRIDGSSGPWFAVYQSVAAVVGKTYTFDGYLDIASNNGTQIDMKVQFLDSAGTVISDNVVVSYPSTTGPTSGFVNMHGAYVAPAATATVRVYVFFTNMRAVMYFDDMSLTSN